MITVSKQISTHFHSTEFRCKCGCGQIKIDEDLVSKMENIFSRLNASKCIISSGYRCPSYDKVIGGFVGRHAEGLAADCCYYDKDGNIIPSKYVICAAYDLDQLRGIAMIRGGNYTHLDNRSEGYYKGDESVSNNSVWSNPYDYFGVSKNDMAKYTGEIIEKKSIDEIAQDVIDGKYGNYPERKTKLEAEGYNYQEVQNRVNELVNKVVYLSNPDYSGSSIVDALKQIGVDSSYNYRSKLANLNGIVNYCGSAEQNTKMLEMLKNGTLKSA